jgi:hypothetical protein
MGYYKLCITFDMDNGWIAKLGIQGLIEHTMLIPIDYKNAPIKCKYCLKISHKIVKC